MKITKAFDWHLEGQIIDKNPSPIPVPQGYVEKMKISLQEQKIKLKIKKQQKIIKLKEKKQKLLQKTTSQVKTSEEKLSSHQNVSEMVKPTQKMQESSKAQPNYLLLVGFILCICLALIANHFDY